MALLLECNIGVPRCTSGKSISRLFLIWVSRLLTDSAPVTGVGELAWQKHHRLAFQYKQDSGDTVFQLDASGDRRDQADVMRH
jgi:hypothetical protein